MNQLKLLLIEDNPDDYETLKRAFKTTSIDLTISWFTSGEKAIRQLKNLITNNDFLNIPNIIILDLNIPGMDGRETLIELKPLCSTHLIPIIILTTSDDHNDIIQCYESGANSFIQKPITFEELKKICKSLIEYWFNTVILPQRKKYY